MLPHYSTYLQSICLFYFLIFSPSLIPITSHSFHKPPIALMPALTHLSARNHTRIDQIVISSARIGLQQSTGIPFCRRAFAHTKTPMLLKQQKLPQPTAYTLTRARIDVHKCTLLGSLLVMWTQCPHDTRRPFNATVFARHIHIVVHRRTAALELYRHMAKLATRYIISKHAISTWSSTHEDLHWSCARTPRSQHRAE